GRPVSGDDEYERVYLYSLSRVRETHQDALGMADGRWPIETIRSDIRHPSSVIRHQIGAFHAPCKNRLGVIDHAHAPPVAPSCRGWVRTDRAGGAAPGGGAARTCGPGR